MSALKYIISAAFIGVLIIDLACGSANLVQLQHDLKNNNNQFSDGYSSGIQRLLHQGLISFHFGIFLSILELDETLQIDLLADVSDQCRDHTDAWLKALITRNVSTLLGKNFWALQMIDAWAKLPEGILTGHTAAWGDFDECLAVRAELEGYEVNNFKGLYCSVMMVPFIDPAIGVNEDADDESIDIQTAQGGELNMMTLALLIPKIGVCYPSSCSDQDVAQLLNNTVRLIPEVGQYILPVVTYCTTDDSRELNTGDISMVSILSVILAMCLCGTLADLILDHQHPKRNGYGFQALVAFSVYINTKKWLNTKGGGGGENFGAMHGIRFLSTCWVVLAHQWGQIVYTTWNMMDVGKLYKSNWTMFSILNGTVAVDTFFTMSGLLFAYNMLKVLNKSKGKINIPMMYVHRYLRLTPTYALLVGLVATLYSYLGNGPNWVSVNQASEACRNHWWHNILYINNFFSYPIGNSADGMCHLESWYLANDMQFFLISPLIIYPLFKWEKVGMALLSVVSIASVATPWIVHATYDPSMQPTLLPTRIMDDYFDVSYIKPWMRFGAYAVGLWAGFLLYKTSNKKLPKLVVLMGWLLSTALALAIVFGIIPWFDPENEIPNGLGAFYAGTHRFAWGLVISWIIFACSRGYGGPVNAFLSWKASIPLGRLSFCVYLISYALQAVFTARMRQVITYDAYVTTNLFFSQLVLSLLVGFICCITMESPFIALEKLLFQGPTKVVQEAKIEGEKKAEV